MELITPRYGAALTPPDSLLSHYANQRRLNPNPA